MGSLKSIFIGVVALLSFQCGTVRRDGWTKKEFRKVYIEQFKLTYVRRLLDAGFNQSPAIKQVLLADRSGFTEPLLTADDLAFMDSVVARDSRQLRADSARSVGRIAEGAEGKHVLALILQRVESGWLDNLAKERYRKQRRKPF